MKKIAFIVVGIVAVGGIGYYLYKRNKQVVSKKITYVQSQASPIVDNAYDDSNVSVRADRSI
jgi:LPXTG-motif cell wall-anchored protein